MFKGIKNYLYLILSQYKLFWVFQEKITNIIFKTKKKLFSSKNFIEDKKETYDAYLTFRNWSLLRITVIIFSTILLQLISPFFEIILKAIFHSITPDFISFKLYPMTNSEYITFFAAIATLGGVFIALYFSTLSAINATLYNTFSNNLRDLLYREKLGNSYIRFLSNTTFFAFVIIVFFLLGYEKIYPAIPLMLVLIGTTIFSYIELGMYTSKLFNVDTLSFSIFKNLYKYIDKSTKKDMYNKDRNFQNHYFTLASQEVRLLTSLLDTSLSKYEIHNDSLQNISIFILRLLTFYQEKKRLIPYESLWYKQKQEYKDLYKPDNLSLNIYLQSATMPQGETKYDLFWLEKKLIPFIIRILVNKIKNDEIEDYKNILHNLDKYLSYLIQLGNLEYTINIISQLKDEVNKANLLNDTKTFELTQYIYSLPLNLIFNFYNNIEVYSYSNTSRILNSNDIMDENIQYKFQVNVIETLNWLQQRLEIEYEAENEKITPMWYQVEILMLTITKNFLTNIENINELTKKFFDKDLKNKDLQLYSVMLTQKWETINKYILNFYKIETILNEYIKERKINGLAWKSFSIDKFRKQNLILKKECILEIGNVLHKISTKENENFPDIFGYFLQITSNNLLELSIENNITDLKEIYPSFLLSSLLKYDSLKPTYDKDIDKFDRRKRNEFIVSFHPLLNLIEITGLIKVMLEANNDLETWNYIEDLWVKLLNNPESNINIELIELVISMTESEIGMHVGDEQRFNWKNKVLDFLETQIERDTYYPPNQGKYSFFHSEDIVIHENVLIREFVGDKRYRSDIDGTDIFIHYLLNKNFEKKEFNFGWKKNNRPLENSLKRNIKIYEEYKNARK